MTNQSNWFICRLFCQTPYTIYHAPYTLHHTPYTLHHTPYTIHESYTIHHSWSHHTRYTIHVTPYTHTPYTQTPYTIHAYTIHHTRKIGNVARFYRCNNDHISCVRQKQKIRRRILFITQQEKAKLCQISNTISRIPLSN